METANGMIARLRREGKLVEVYEGYDRYIMMDDGRTFKQTYKKTAQVWLNEEEGIYYKGLAEAIYDNNGRRW